MLSVMVARGQGVAVLALIEIEAGRPLVVTLPVSAKLLKNVVAPAVMANFLPTVMARVWEATERCLLAVTVKVALPVAAVLAILAVPSP